jgi:type III pantothenate kinase
MKLVLDIGNTLVKAGIFEGKDLLEITNSHEFSISFIDSMAEKYSTISGAILSSVKEIGSDVSDHLKRKYRFLEFTENTPIPITNLYKTPATLGKDRLAGVIAASTLYPKKNVLVIDAGTCITYDLITSEKKYSGGGISPGLSMRFTALHTFTGKLPLVTLADCNDLIGNDTDKSILSGVINGTVAEIEGIIERYVTYYDSLTVLICGGDGHFLADRIKSSIFAVPELLLIGLNEILDYNGL